MYVSEMHKCTSEKNVHVPGGGGCQVLQHNGANEAGASRCPLLLLGIRLRTRLLKGRQVRHRRRDGLHQRRKLLHVSRLQPRSRVLVDVNWH